MAQAILEAKRGLMGNWSEQARCEASTIGMRLEELHRRLRVSVRAVDASTRRVLDIIG